MVSRRRTPPPKFTVGVCRDVTCLHHGGEPAKSALRAVCAGRDDVEFHEVSCLGRCDSAPACVVNDVPVPPGEVPAILDGAEDLPPDEPTASPRRWKTDPYGAEEERYGVLRGLLGAPDRDAAITGVIARLKDSGLRGMGGAGFPTGLKWELVRKEPATPKYLVCNADESEPGTFKDRVILEELPHLVVEGIILGALTVGARQGWVYIRHEYTREAKAIQREIDRAYAAGALGGDVLGSGLAFDLELFVSPGGYILGEEPALLEALEGKRGEPRNKPPYPGTEGYRGKPTLINNVESYAHVPRILSTGKAEHKFFSISGDIVQPGVYEMPVGATLDDLVKAAGGMRDGRKIQAFLPGGASTEFLRGEQSGVPLTWDDLAQAGSALGSGAVVVFGEGSDLLALAQNLTEFFRNESCGKCVPCRIGTQKTVELIGSREREALDRVPELHETLLETSICGLGQAALNPILSLLRRFPETLPGR